MADGLWLTHSELSAEILAVTLPLRCISSYGNLTCGLTALHLSFKVSDFRNYILFYHKSQICNWMWPKWLDMRSRKYPRLTGDSCKRVWVCVYLHLPNVMWVQIVWSSVSRLRWFDSSCYSFHEPLARFIQSVYIQYVTRIPIYHYRCAIWGFYLDVLVSAFQIRIRRSMRSSTWRRRGEGFVIITRADLGWLCIDLFDMLSLLPISTVLVAECVWIRSLHRLNLSKSAISG